MIYLILWGISQFGYTKPLCDKIHVLGVLYSSTIVILSQITFALRVYAVTGKNKILGGLLSALISAQLCFGFYLVMRLGMGSPQPLPEIDLDQFKVCLTERWQVGEIASVGIPVVFDLIAFLAILVTVKRQGIYKYMGVSCLLDIIFRDATVYFLCMFACQILLGLFLLFAPTEIRIVPGVEITALVPIMTTRLMLSLKKAAAEPATPWSLSTMSESGGGTMQYRDITHSTPRILGGSRGMAATHTLPNEMDMEPESIRPSRNCGPQQSY